MDDRGSPCVEEVEAFENLPAPASQNFGLHHLETFQIPESGRISHDGANVSA